MGDLLTGLLEITPFSMALDAGGVIRRLGRFYEERFPDLVGQQVNTVLSVYGRRNLGLMDAIIEARTKTRLPRRIELVFTPPDGGIAPILLIADTIQMSNGDIFLRATVAPDADLDLSELGMTITDFGGADLAFDLFLIRGTHTAVMNDLRLVNSQLRASQTELGQALEAQRELAMVAESTSDLVAILDMDRRIQWVNDAFERLTGRNLASVQGKLFMDVLGMRLCPDQTEWPETGPLIFEVPCETRTGELLWLSLRVNLVRDRKGIPSRIIVVATDTTEARRLLEALQLQRDTLEETVLERTETIAMQAARLQESLEAERRLNSMQRNFVSMASHEFRTPLAIIDAASRRILRKLEPADEEAIRGQIDKIHRSVARMLRLIESTLAAAKVESGELKIRPMETDLVPIVQAACEAQAEITPAHRIHLECDRNLPLVADPDAVTQVLANLLSNAAKYSPGADRIDVTARNVQEGVRLCVRDYGLGVPEAERPRLFERFFRASTSTGIPGTGLGLNLVAELVTRHGGTISYEAPEGGGSRFCVELPRVARPDVPVPASTEAVTRGNYSHGLPQG